MQPTRRERSPNGISPGNGKSRHSGKPVRPCIFQHSCNSTGRRTNSGNNHTALPKRRTGYLPDPSRYRRRVVGSEGATGGTPGNCPPYCGCPHIGRRHSRCACQRYGHSQPGPATSCGLSNSSYAVPCSRPEFDGAMSPPRHRLCTDDMPLSTA